MSGGGGVALSMRSHIEGGSLVGVTGVADWVAEMSRVLSEMPVGRSADLRKVTDFKKTKL